VGPVSVTTVEAGVLVVADSRASATVLEELARGGRFRLLGRVESVRGAAEAARTRRADVLVVEVSTPQRLREAVAVLGAGPGARAVVVSGLPAEAALLPVMAAGARAFLQRPLAAGLLEEAIAAVVAGHTFVDARSTGWLIDLAMHGRRSRPLDGLTLRQSQVVELVRGGLTNREIARLLGVSPGTVKTHLHEAMRRLGVTDRWAATVLAERLREDRP
jgi:DNA-binding NarL/FixJ family response regulator